jgi:molecular chaperone DnaK (HSP70)
VSKKLSIDAALFVKECALSAGLPSPIIVFSGACAAVQYSVTCDSSSEKSVIVLDFGELNTCITHVNLDFGKQNNITVSSYQCSPLYSGKSITNTCIDLIASKSGIRDQSMEDRLSLLGSASVLKEKLTSNENYIMAVFSYLLMHRLMKVPLFQELL